MIVGAKNTISTLAPKFSICTCHLPDDPEVLEAIIKAANLLYVLKHKWKSYITHV